MKKNLILLTLIFSFTTILVGCESDQSDEKSTTITENTIPSSQETSAEQVLADKTAKGNLWLDAYKENFYPIVSEKKNQLISGANFNILQETYKVLEGMSHKKDFIFDVSTIKVPDLNETSTDEERFQINISRTTISANNERLAWVFRSNNFSTDKAELAAESFDYILNLSPKIEILDNAGKKYSLSYLNLLNAMQELGSYFYTERTYRLDNYAQGESLYNAVLEAYNAHVLTTQGVFEAYDVYYQEMHQEEKELLKTNGFIVLYNIMEALDSIEDLMFLIQQEEISINNLELILTNMHAISKALNNVLNDEKALKKEFPSSVDINRIKKYLDKYNQLAIEVQVLIKNLSDNNPKEFDKNIRTLDSQYEAFIKLYNSVIS